MQRTSAQSRSCTARGVYRDSRRLGRQGPGAQGAGRHLDAQRRQVEVQSRSTAEEYEGHLHAVPDGVKISVDVAWDGGESQHWEMAGKYDGKDYPITGNPAADMASFKMVNDHTGESTFKKDGKVTATNTRVLSKDGKTLTITSKGTTRRREAAQRHAGLREGRNDVGNSFLPRVAPSASLATSHVSALASSLASHLSRSPRLSARASASLRAAGGIAPCPRALSRCW